MAGFTETIRLLLDVQADSARNAIKKLGTDLKSTDGAFGKAKVAGTALGDTLKANIAGASVAAGTALVAFGVKSVKAFQDVALKAGELRDATGLTAEEASRLGEVASDIGVDVEGLGGSINKMNKAAATTPEAFDAIGAAIARNEDGTINVMETYLNAVDALNKMPDSAAKAEAATKLFGRGWQASAELISKGREGIVADMATVNESLVVDDEGIVKAREFRDSWDDLSDSVNAFSIMLGEELVPTLTQAANVFTPIVGLVGDLKGALDAIPDVPIIGKIVGPLAMWERAADTIDTVKGMLKEDFEPEWVVDLKPQMEEAAEATDEFGESVTDTANAIRDAAGVSGNIQGVVDAIRDAAEAAAENKERQRENAESLREVRDAANEARQNVRDLTAAIIDSTGAEHDAEKAQLAIRDAVDSWRQSQQDANDTVDDSNTVIDEHAQAIDDARSAELGAADAILVGAQAYAKEAGAREGSRKSAELQIAALKAAQDQYPELRDEIQAYIDRLDDVPTKKETQVHIEKAAAAQRLREHVKDLEDTPKSVKSDILALIDEGKLQAAKDKLQEIEDAERVAEILTEAKTEAAAGDIAAIVDAAYEASIDVSSDAATEGAAIDNAARNRTSYIDVQSNVQAIIDLIRSLPGVGTSGTSSVGGSASGNGDAPTVPPPARARELMREAEGMARQAAALREQAAATEDADEKERLLEQARTLLEKATQKATKANDVHANAIRKVAAEHDREANALRNSADALRENAAERRENAAAAADALRERAGSFDEFVDAALRVEDAAERAAEARATAQRALTTEGVTGAQREEAVEEARNAALDLARAEVERERERAERAGKEFTEADEAKALRDSLRRQAAQGGPVGREIRDLIKLMNFPQQLELIKRAEKREEKADKRADREEDAARNQDQAARTQERAANKLERAADKIDGAVIRFDAEQIGAIMREALRRDRARSNQSVRAGRR